MVKNSLFISSLLLAFLFYTGAAKVGGRRPFVSLVKSGSISYLEGTLRSNPARTSLFGSSYRVSVIVENVRSQDGFYQAKGEAAVFVPATLAERFYPGKLYTSCAGGSDGFLLESGGRFSFEVEAIKNQGFENSFLVKGGRFLGWDGNPITKRLRHFRALCRLQFKRLMYSWGEAGGLLLALLSGCRDYTEKSLSEAFRDSGLSHILALSGMHLGLFGSIARFFGKKARGQNFGDGIQLAAVFFFVWFAGLSPSLFRALLASVILYLNSFFRMSRPDSLSLLSLCFMLHCVIFPEHIFEPAFMLSYSSLAGIIIMGGFLKKICPSFIPHGLRLSLSESGSAHLATAPVSLRLFGKIAPQGIAAASLVSPLVMIFLYAGLFAVIICLIMPFLSEPFGAIMRALYLLIKKLVIFFSFR